MFVSIRISAVSLCTDRLSRSILDGLSAAVSFSVAFGTHAPTLRNTVSELDVAVALKISGS